METKQKTWEDIFKESAELFNSSTAEERDELKEKLKIAIDGISDLEKEYRKTEAELNSYSRIAHQLKEENERLKEEIKLQLKDNAKSLEEFAILKVKYNSLGVKFDKETERWQERDQNERAKIDSLKQLNSELLRVIDETVNHMDKYDTVLERHSLLYDKMKNMLSKASDGYTKAKD